MKNFILATRPKTLLAGLIPPLMSYSYFTAHSAERPWFILVCILVSALGIQIATNLFNDLIDFKKGADAVRHGPVRVTASGLVPPKTVLVWALLTLLVSVLFSLPLISIGGSWILILGVLSLYLSYGYTGGPFPLAYIGLGELFVFLFFGLFSVCGSYYLFSGALPPEIWWLASACGLLTTTLICVNNLRDRVEDQKVGKRTLATRMSEKAYRGLSLITVIIPLLLLLKLLPLRSLLYALILLPVTAKLSLIILKGSGGQLNQGLKFGGIQLLLYSLFFYLSVHYGYLLS